MPSHQEHVTRNEGSKDKKSRRNRSRSRHDVRSKSTWDLPTALSHTEDASMHRALAYEEYARWREEGARLAAAGQLGDGTAHERALKDALIRLRQNRPATIEQVRDAYGVPGAEVHGSDSLGRLTADILQVGQDVRLYVEATSDLDHRTYSFKPGEAREPGPDR